ncbi:MAG TPA: hypothetical protein VIO94_12265 [Phenylobacterium sp.]
MTDKPPPNINHVFVAAGALWLAVTGLCTWGISQGNDEYGFWIIGLFIIPLGAVPLVIGLLHPDRLAWLRLLLSGLMAVFGGLLLLIGLAMAFSGAMAVLGLLSLAVGGVSLAGGVWIWRDHARRRQARAAETPPAGR